LPVLPRPNIAPVRLFLAYYRQKRRCGSSALQLDGLAVIEFYSLKFLGCALLVLGGNQPGI
jgi:hypothetical protein